MALDVDNREVDILVDKDWINLNTDRHFILIGGSYISMVQGIFRPQFTYAEEIQKNPSARGAPGNLIRFRQLSTS